MYRYDFPIVAIIVVILMLIMTTDAKVLCGIICIPAGIVMLKQWHHTENTEDSEKYDPIAIIIGMGMLFFGICILINYIFVK
ncbi:MAG: hypothetical protein IKI37_08955 [Oscillospiraceae bacterium]|nr:hypothetical protein [Oscillospiraceae bacterium]MBR7085289.1 hypothetical protein [Oscillospiraceae bacterium]